MKGGFILQNGIARKLRSKFKASNSKFQGPNCMRVFGARLGS
jgi:hypothetical protein